MKEQMLRNVDVLGGGGGVLAHSNDGNLAGGTIVLGGLAPAGLVQSGANYSLRDNNAGQTYRTTCTSVDAASASFHVH